MYLGGGPPPSGPLPASSQPSSPPARSNSSAAVGAAVSQVSKDMIRHSATFNFTNVGLNACSDISACPKNHVNSSSHSLFIKSLDMNLRLGTRMQPAAPFMRTHAHTLNGEFRFCVTFTEPCFSRSTAQSFGDDIVTLASSFAEDVSTPLTPLPLQSLHMIVS
ncbi:Hypothetical protein, putative [Bodo saltans]|uniref:Uncharacterized protein n=1 Tax=Bodo saltans TaxID=75058 RepID=A0A0S4JVB7_BODSA|nr:Hypothetical protein, putative [Bodo saltans]|eukprot:CUG94341.1 Hypothetical protein, putative [Bodo saltans]